MARRGWRGPAVPSWPAYMSEVFGRLPGEGHPAGRAGGRAMGSIGRIGRSWLRGAVCLSVVLYTALGAAGVGNAAVEGVAAENIEAEAVEGAPTLSEPSHPVAAPTPPIHTAPTNTPPLPPNRERRASLDSLAHPGGGLKSFAALPQPWRRLWQAERFWALNRPQTVRDWIDRLLDHTDVKQRPGPYGEAVSAEGWWLWRAHMLRARSSLLLAEPEEAVVSARQALQLAVGPTETIRSRVLLAEALRETNDVTAQGERLDVLLAIARSGSVFYEGPLLQELLAEIDTIVKQMAETSRPRPDGRAAAGERSLWTARERLRMIEYGQLLYRFGRWRDGVRHFSLAQWGEGEAEQVVELARGLAVLGRREEAVSHLQKRLQMAPQEEPVLRNALAEHLQALSRWDEATQHDLLLLGSGGAYSGAALYRLIERLLAGQMSLADLPDLLDARPTSGGISTDGGAAPTSRISSPAVFGVQASPVVQARALLEQAGAPPRSAWYELALWRLFFESLREIGATGRSADDVPDEMREQGVSDSAESVLLWSLRQLKNVSPHDPQADYWRGRLGDQDAYRRLQQSHPLHYFTWAQTSLPIRGEAVPPGRDELRVSGDPDAADAVSGEVDLPLEAIPALVPAPQVPYAVPEPGLRTAPPPPPRPIPLRTANWDEPSLASRLTGPTRAAQVRLATDLGQAGWWEASAGEWRRLAAVDPDPLVYVRLIEAAQRLHRYSEALGYAERLALQLGGRQALWPNRHGPARRPLQWLYPRPYRSLVEQEGRAAGVPPALIYAVMRKESTFAAGAISTAGARGVMQMLPDTARWVVETLLPRQGGQGDGGGDDDGIRLVNEPDSLFHPPVAVRLGTAYIRWLVERYGDVRLALAAYDAGPGRVDRWLQERGWRRPWRGPASELESFLEQLPVRATRDYVYEVYADYRTYEALYGEEGVEP